MNPVATIIPFYREHEKLRRCLACVDGQEGVECETFVRDNSEDNILYTAAVNEGLARFVQRGDVRYVLLLNQDAYMDADCVRHLVEFMESNPECGIASPVQYAEARVPQSSWGGSLQAWPFGVHRSDAIAAGTEPFETPWANGACMMVRMETVHECGRLDANMRFIYSDTDFSFTARTRGWRVFVVPKARCEHSQGASSTIDNVELELVKCRDTAYFANKWLTGSLYRQLAWEGAMLTPIQVRSWMRVLRHREQTLERALGAGPGEGFPSLLFGLR